MNQEKIRDVALKVSSRGMTASGDAVILTFDELTRCLAELSRNVEPDFYIFKETSPRLGIPNVRVDALPWVYDQDPSTGFSARLGVYLKPPPTVQDKLDFLDSIICADGALIAGLKDELAAAKAELKVVWETNSEEELLAQLTEMTKQRDELLAALERLAFAAQCRDNTTGDQCRLIEVRAELAAAAANASAAITKVKGAER